MNTDPLEVPQSDEKDVAHIAITTVLSTFPFVGLGELFKFIISPSLDKRRDQWMQAVADAIRELQYEGKSDIKSLLSDDEFTTLLLQATQAALKTHLDSKHLQLKKAVKNAFTVNVNFDLKQLYISLIDRLTPTHLFVLDLVSIYAIHSYETNEASGLYTLSNNASNVSSIEKIGLTEFLAFLTDLQQNGLIETSEGYIHGNSDGYVESVLLIKSTENDSLVKARIAITELGNSFMRFIKA